MSGEAGDQGAVRLVFEYHGDDVRLVAQQPVDMAVIQLAPDDAGPAGHAVETRDAEGRRLARVTVRGGFQQSAEVFPEDHTEPITRIDVEPQGAFTVVVPAHDAAAQVAVLRVHPPQVAQEGADGLAAPARAAETELGSFPLEAREDRP